jgi:hypothetical protein
MTPRTLDPRPAALGLATAPRANTRQPQHPAELRRALRNHEISARLAAVGFVLLCLIAAALAGSRP